MRWLLFLPVWPKACTYDLIQFDKNDRFPSLLFLAIQIGLFKKQDIFADALLMTLNNSDIPKMMIRFLDDGQRKQILEIDMA